MEDTIMTYSTNRKTPELKSRIPLSFLTGFVFMVAAMLALPFTQRMVTPEKPNIDVTGCPQFKPPDEFFNPPPPPPKPKDDDIQFVDQEPEKLDLNKIDIFFRPDLGALANSDWTIPGGFGEALTETIHTIGELTNPPHPVRRMQPIYPAQLRSIGIEGDVLVMFVVRADGTVSNIEILRSTHREFADSVKRSVRKWLFQPGEKDGQAVHTRVRQAFPFRIH